MPSGVGKLGCAWGRDTGHKCYLSHWFCFKFYPSVTMNPAQELGVYKPHGIFIILYSAFILLSLYDFCNL